MACSFLDPQSLSYFGCQLDLKMEQQLFEVWYAKMVFLSLTHMSYQLLVDRGMVFLFAWVPRKQVPLLFQ